MNNNAFKHVFLEKKLLISLVNETMSPEMPEDKICSSIEFRPTLLGPRHVYEKQSEADFILENENQIVIIEAQNYLDHLFEMRCLYYVTSIFSRQLETNEKYNSLKKVSLIAYCTDLSGDNELKKQEISSIQEVGSIQEIGSTREIGSIQSNFLKLNFINLKNFVKNHNELDTANDEWLWLLKNSQFKDSHQYVKNFKCLEVKEAFEKFISYKSYDNKENLILKNDMDYNLLYKKKKKYFVNNRIERMEKAGLNTEQVKKFFKID